MKKKLGALATGAVFLTALGACETTSSGPFAPAGTKGGVEAVDPLVVGNRLMAGGEYELARDAYLRAAAETGVSAEILTAIGSADLQLGRLGQAERNLRAATEMDEFYVPAWNNLGVVLMEQGKFAEAKLIFEIAFKIDSGKTESIANNLKLALAKSQDPGYVDENITNFSLIRQGSGEYLLLGSP